jgi:hypothetical protein
MHGHLRLLRGEDLAKGEGPEAARGKGAAVMPLTDEQREEAMQIAGLRALVDLPVYAEVCGPLACGRGLRALQDEEACACLSGEQYCPSSMYATAVQTFPQAFLKCRSEKKGFLSLPELVSFVKAADYMLKYFAALEKDLQVGHALNTLSQVGRDSNPKGRDVGCEVGSGGR